jgi:hypothetical protein
MLIKAMVGHAVIDSRTNEADYKWLHKSELAELYCEITGLDIFKCRKVAARICKSDNHWRSVKKLVDLAHEEVIPVHHPYKITHELAVNVIQDYKYSRSHRKTAKKFGISTGSVRVILTNPGEYCHE